jgi:hypothetical protein
MPSTITEIDAFDLVGRLVGPLDDPHTEYVVTHLTHDAVAGRVLIWIDELDQTATPSVPVGQPRAMESLDGFSIHQPLDPAFRRDSEVDLVGRIVTNPHGVPFAITRLSFDARTAQVLFWLDDVDEGTGEPLGHESGQGSLDGFALRPRLRAVTP